MRPRPMGEAASRLPANHGMYFPATLAEYCAGVSRIYFIADRPFGVFFARCRSIGWDSPPPFAATLAQLPFPHFCAIRPLPPEDRGALTTHWVLEGVSLGATIRADTYGPAWRRAGIDGCEICADPLPGGPAAGDVVARAGPAVVVAFRREETSALLKYTPSCRTVRNSEKPEADGNSPPHPIESGAT